MIGGAARLYSVQLNIRQHGDVALYTATAESLVSRHDFLIDPDTTQPYFYSLKDKGGRFLEHNPLWPLMGAVLVYLGIGSYTALKILSVVSGILFLPLIYAYAKRLGGEQVAAFVFVLSSLSFALIDYSGNGSFYNFEAGLYVVFLWLLLHLEEGRTPIWLGVVMGLGWLLNQQTLTMFFTYVVYVFFIHTRFSPKQSFSLIAPSFLTMFALFFPWGMHNAAMFGSFFYTIDTTNFWQKLGMKEIIDANNIIHYPITTQSYIQLFKSMITFWFPHNLYFINRKLFVLAPFSYIFAWFFAVEVFFKESLEKAKKFLPILLLLFFHICISAPWPIAKFRYLIPMLPFVFLLGGLFISEYVRPLWRRWSYGACIAFTIAFSVLTYLGVPSHTYYYEGVPTEDIYGKQGEKDFYN
ncbi:MAG: glycosyltransferase family 39 protein [Patescibacteria group bacterium]